MFQRDNASDLFLKLFYTYKMAVWGGGWGGGGHITISISQPIEKLCVLDLWDFPFGYGAGLSHF